MIVNSVNIKFIKPHNGLIGFANVVVDNNLYLSSIAIFERIDRTYRLQYPTKKISDGREVHVFAPINQTTNKTLEEAVSSMINRIKSERNEYDRYYKSSNLSGL